MTEQRAMSEKHGNRMTDTEKDSKEKDEQKLTRAVMAWKIS